MKVMIESKHFDHLIKWMTSCKKKRVGTIVIADFASKNTVNYVKLRFDIDEKIEAKGKRVLLTKDLDGEYEVSNEK